MKQNQPSPFCRLYDPLPDLPSYLQRIGFNGTPIPTLECLCELTRCHLLAVPFENLDIFHGGLTPSLETEALFEKIVTRRRGGYCFELNGLFQKLLEAVGFSCCSSMARILLGRGYLPPFAHRVVIVFLDGKRYLCDVGYGGPAPLCPIEIESGKIQVSPNGIRYRLAENAGSMLLEAELDGNFQPLMSFSQTPRDPVDFLPLNAYCALSPYEPFQSRQMLYKIIPGGKCAVNGNLLRIKENGSVTESVLKNEEELRGALQTWFGIVYDGEMKPVY